MRRKSEIVDDPTLPRGWKKYITENGKEYYYNTKTKESKWTRPPPDAPTSDEAPVSPQSRPPPPVRPPPNKNLSSKNDVAENNIVTSPASASTGTEQIIETVEPFKNQEPAEIASPAESDTSSASSLPTPSPSSSSRSSRPPPPNRSVGSRPPPPSRKVGVPAQVKQDDVTTNPMTTSSNARTSRNLSEASSDFDSLEMSILDSSKPKIVNQDEDKHKSGISDIMGDNDNLDIDRNSGLHHIIESTKQSNSSNENRIDEEQYLLEFQDDENNKFDNDAHKSKVKSNLPCPSGLSRTTRSQVEIPQEWLSRLLLQDEEVVAHFDALFPEMVMSRGTFLMLGFLTLGMYWFYYFVIRPIGQCLWKVMGGICCPLSGRNIKFSRTKMVVTDKGRVLCWNQTCDQHPSLGSGCCSRGLNFSEIEHQTFVFHVRDLRQWNLAYEDSDDMCKSCFCCSCSCFRRYSTGVEISFHSFMPSNVRQSSSSSTSWFALFPSICLPSLTSSTWGDSWTPLGKSSLMDAGIIHIFPRSTFLESINSIVTELFSPQERSFSQRIHRCLACREAVVFRISSDRSNECYDGEFGVETLEDLSSIMISLNDIYGKYGGSSKPLNQQDTSASSMEGGVNGKGMKACRVSPVFLGTEASEDLELKSMRTGDSKNDEASMDPGKNKTDSTNNSNGSGSSNYLYLSGVRGTFDGYEDFVLIDEDGKVTIPLKYMPLLPEERVVAAISHRSTLSLSDYILSFLTLGYYYSTVCHRKLRRRSAVVLTTHRLTEFILEESRGRIPPGLVRFQFLVSHYFPSSIDAGYLYCPPAEASRRQVTSGLDCAGGHLVLTISRRHLDFVQKMQMTCSRAATLSIQEYLDMKLPSTLASMKKAATTANTVSPTHSRRRTMNMNMNITNINLMEQGLSGKSTEENKLPSIEQNLLPLCNNEVVLHRIAGGAVYHPWGSFCSSNSNVNQRRLPQTPSYCCSFRDHSSLIDCMKCLSCGRFPQWSTPGIVITDHTLYYVLTTHEPPSGKFSGDIDELTLDAADVSFSIAWTPIRSFSDFRLQLSSKEGHAVQTQCGCCGIPSRTWKRSNYFLELFTRNGYNFPLQGSLHDPYHPQEGSWLKSEDLRVAQGVMGVVERAISEELSNSV